jgi:hypothetical protein
MKERVRSRGPEEDFGAGDWNPGNESHKERETS